MKAILLAGGIGSRLFPVTFGISKQLIPVYDKPMIYYPLSVLMLAGIRDVLVISTPIDMSSYKRLLGDGSQWGIRLQYKIQEQPEGLAQAFILGEEFIGQDPVCLILGDNIFYGDKISQKLKDCIEIINEKASVFGYHVEDPKRYGIIAFDSERNVISIEEKPTHPKSNYAERRSLCCESMSYRLPTNELRLGTSFSTEQKSAHDSLARSDCLLPRSPHCHHAPEFLHILLH